MTEEQKEKYANFLDKISEILGLNKPVDILRLCAVTDEYLRPIEKHIAELEAERLKWHDLRKDPNDLPNGYRVVLNQVGMTTQYDPNRGFLGFGGAGIIAWCEIPIFDKE